MRTCRSMERRDARRTTGQPDCSKAALPPSSTTAEGKPASRRAAQALRARAPDRQTSTTRSSVHAVGSALSPVSRSRGTL